MHSTLVLSTSIQEHKTAMLRAVQGAVKAHTESMQPNRNEDVASTRPIQEW